jgi:hypothetical protein
MVLLNDSTKWYLGDDRESRTGVSLTLTLILYGKLVSVRYYGLIFSKIIPSILKHTL